MKDLLLLPFYLTAFFSNSLETLTSTDLEDRTSKREKFEIKIDLNQFSILESLTNEDAERKTFDKESFKQELLQSGRKK